MATKARCPYCAHKLDDASVSVCPFCGGTLKREEPEAEAPEKKKKLTEAEKLEQVRAHLEELETRKVEPNIYTLLFCGLVVIFVAVLIITNGFGVFDRKTSNPLGNYRDAAANFLTSDSLNYVSKLTIYPDVLNNPETADDEPYTVTRNGYYAFTGRSSAGFVFDETASDSLGESGRHVIYDGKETIYPRTSIIEPDTDPLIGIIAPFLLTDFTASGGRVMYEPRSWQGMLSGGKYDMKGFENQLKTIISDRAAISGLNFEGESLDRFYELLYRFFDRILDTRSAFDATFRHYKKTTAKESITFEFDFSLDGLIEQVVFNFQGVGSALRWRPMRHEFDRWAVAIDPEYFANDGIAMFYGELQPLADSLGDIHVILKVDRSRNLQYMEMTDKDPLGNPRFKYTLEVSNINSVEYNAEELALFSSR